MAASIQKLTTKSHFDNLISSYGVFFTKSPQSEFFLERENRISETVYSLSGTFDIGRFIIQTNLKLNLPSNKLSVLLSVKDQQSGNHVIPYSHTIIPEHLVTTFLKKDFMASEIKKAMKSLAPDMKMAHFRTLPFTRQTHNFNEVVKELQNIYSKRGYLSFHLTTFQDKPSRVEIGIGTPICQITSYLKGELENLESISGITTFGLTHNLPYISLNEENILVTILMDFAKVIAEPRREDLLDL